MTRDMCFDCWWEKKAATWNTLQNLASSTSWCLKLYNWQLYHNVEVGIFNINPILHPMLVRWNWGLTWRSPTLNCVNHNQVHIWKGHPFHEKGAGERISRGQRPTEIPLAIISSEILPLRTRGIFLLLRLYLHPDIAPWYYTLMPLFIEEWTLSLEARQNHNTSQ